MEVNLQSKDSARWTEILMIHSVERLLSLAMYGGLGGALSFLVSGREKEKEEERVSCLVEV